MYCFLAKKGGLLTERKKDETKKKKKKRRVVAEVIASGAVQSNSSREWQPSPWMRWSTRDPRYYKGV